MKGFPLKPVLVLWEDTASGAEGWQSVKSLLERHSRKHSDGIFGACGFLGGITRYRVVLVGLCDGTGTATGVPVRIPIGCVVAVFELGLMKKVKIGGRSRSRT